jgi:hypothetical protein
VTKKRGPQLSSPYARPNTVANVPTDFNQAEAGVTQSQVGALQKLWLGLYPLPVAFWLFYFFGPSALWLLLYVGPVLAWQRPLPALEIVTSIILWAYGIIGSVAVWRSAGSYMRCPMLRKRIWAWLARCVVVLLGVMALMYGPGAFSILSRVLVFYAAHALSGG